ncbi:hypothetical protein CLJ1_3610 [Pseudomonas paraeruginosa]|nr:hypothetical protein CLJ1_3610 [Pseudomonas aeruginosa]
MVLIGASLDRQVSGDRSVREYIVQSAESLPLSVRTPSETDQGICFDAPLEVRNLYRR